MYLLRFWCSQILWWWFSLVQDDPTAVEKHHVASHLWNGSEFLHGFLILPWVLTTWILYVKVSTGQEIKKNKKVYHLIWLAGGFKQRTAPSVSQQIIWIYYFTYYCHSDEVSSYYTCFWTQILWWTIDPQELKMPLWEYRTLMLFLSSQIIKCMPERTWRRRTGPGSA